MPETMPWDNDPDVTDAPGGAPWEQDQEMAGAPEQIGRTGLAGRPATMSAAEAPPWYEGAWEAARQAIFGDPDREAAREAGVGLQPTTAEMVETGLAGSAFVGGPAAAGPVVGRMAARLPGVSGAVAKAGSVAARHPRTVAAAAAALPSALQGNFDQALTQAAIAAGTSGRGQAGRAPAPRPRTQPRSPRRAASPPTSAQSAPAQEPVWRNQQGDVITPYAQRGSSAPAASAPRAPAQAAPAPATPAARQPSTRPDPGRAAAQAHRNLMSFAKSVAARNPKVGEKIWMRLDDAGNPVEYLTPDQAASAARRGLPTTWVKNLWD